jgi:hypothetical protein
MIPIFPTLSPSILFCNAARYGVGSSSSSHASRLRIAQALVRPLRKGELAVSLQHTPVIRIVECRINIHREVAMSAEWAALKRLGEEISAHFVSLTISDHDVTRIDLDLDEEVQQVQMLRPLQDRLSDNSADVGSTSCTHGRSIVKLVQFRSHRVNSVIAEYLDPLDIWLVARDAPSMVV